MLKGGLVKTFIWILALFVVLDSTNTVFGKTKNCALLMSNLSESLQNTQLLDILPDLHPEKSCRKAAASLDTIKLAEVLTIVRGTTGWKQDSGKTAFWHHTKLSFRLKTEPTPHILIKRRRHAYICELHIDLYYSGKASIVESRKHLIREVAKHLFLPWTQTSQQTIAEHIARMHALL
jgi:hypothetical protein